MRTVRGFTWAFIATSPPKYLSFSPAACLEHLPESTLPNVYQKFREPFSRVQSALPLILYENPFHMIHPFWCTEH